MSEITSRLSTALGDRYRIERELGEGGMATVYLAEDLKHERKVALKVLKPELAAVLGADRFVQEIKTTASLQHPHILPLFDSGSADGFLYYVMPSIEGETLREKLDRETQLGIDEAVRITTEVADALDYAHRQGVIHRDIKPENILLHDGRPMVADFGIALAVSAAAGGRMTETGLSLGTPHYMSPEQATAEKDITARSDIYSLGCVLYEMLAGDPPHTGSTAQQIIMKIVTEEAMAVTKLRKSVPRNVAAALAKALEKLPADRFATAAHFADALTQPFPEAAAPVTAGPAARETPAAGRTLAIRLPSRKAALPWALIAVVGAVALYGWLGRPAPDVLRFAVALPLDQTLSVNHAGSSLAFSPDGRSLVYVGPERRLFVRALDNLQAHPLPGTEGARDPFFAPDGEWVGFFSEGRLSRVALGGGPPLTITDVKSDFRGASWGDDGTVIYTPGSTDPLFVVAAAGGEPRQLTTLDSTTSGMSHRWPHMLPGSKAAVFAIYNGTPNETELAAVSIETGAITKLQLPGVRAQYAAADHLVYGTADGSLVAVPFDKDRLQLTGAPVSLLEGLMVQPGQLTEFAISRAGALAYLEGEAPDLSLVAVDRDGPEEVLAEGLSGPGAPRISSDGTRVALQLDDGSGNDVWVYDLRVRTMTRMTFWGSSWYPAWTPDGRAISFSAPGQDSNGRSLFILPSDGSGTPELLFSGPGEPWESLWMPDARSLIVRSSIPGNARDIALVELDDGEQQPLVATKYEERAPSVSPDGRWLAYCSNESGRDEVYVRPVAAAGGKRQLSVNGGGEPLWSRDGREVYYRGEDGNFYSVAVDASSTVTLGQRRVLFEDSYVRNFSHTNYDQYPSTGRFLFVKGGERPTNLVLVLNWFDELEERMRH